MKLNTLLLSSLLTVASVTAISGQSAFAATATVAADGQSGTSEVKAELTAPAEDKGNLKLTAVPDLDLGHKEITTSNIQLTQDTSKKVSVADARGTGAGYSVSVALTTPLTSGTHTLPGSVLALKNAGGQSIDHATDKIETPITATLNETDGTAAQTIISAPKEKGLGNWDYTIAGSTLDVLPGAYAGVYTGQLTWTLAAVPAAGI